MRKFRISLSQSLFAMMVIGSVMAVVATNLHHRRQVRKLQTLIDDTRDKIIIAQYGQACLDIATLSPEMTDNKHCRRLLAHELAVSVILHFDHELQIDRAMQVDGYSKRFVGLVLTTLELASVSDFFNAADSTLWLYPDDNLMHATYEIEQHQLPEFEQFIEASLDTVEH